MKELWGHCSWSHLDARWWFAAAAQRSASAVGERWAWRLYLTGFTLFTIGGFGAYYGAWINPALIDGAFVALVIPGVLITLVGGTWLGIVLLRRGSAWRDSGAPCLHLPPRDRGLVAHEPRFPPSSPCSSHGASPVGRSWQSAPFDPPRPMSARSSDPKCGRPRPHRVSAGRGQVWICRPADDSLGSRFPHTNPHPRIGKQVDERETERRPRHRSSLT